MRHATFSAHRFTDDLEECSFDINQYSRFKHGSKLAAISMANDMFDRYIPTLNSIIATNCKEFIIFPSPYHFIQSACSLIKDQFLIRLNRYLVDAGCPPAVESQVHRRLTYHTDYGMMGAEERAKLISGDKFYIDREYIKDKFCLFLDDVRITGSHEVEVEKLLPTEVEYQVLYYARYEGSNPTIEYLINTAQVSNMFTLMYLIIAKDFAFNVRNIRMILTSDKFDAYLVSIARAIGEAESLVWRNQLYDLCIGNHFHEVPIYKEQIQYLKTLL